MKIVERRGSNDLIFLVDLHAHIHNMFFFFFFGRVETDLPKKITSTPTYPIHFTVSPSRNSCCLHQGTYNATPKGYNLPFRGRRSPALQSSLAEILFFFSNFSWKGAHASYIPRKKWTVWSIRWIWLEPNWASKRTRKEKVPPPNSFVSNTKCRKDPPKFPVIPNPGNKQNPKSSNFPNKLRVFWTF